MDTSDNRRHTLNIAELDKTAEEVQVIIDTFGLTLQQLFFCEYYLIAHNQTKAARKAGYAAPHVAGHRLLSYASVKKYLSHRFNQFKMSADEVLGRVSRIARADISEFVDNTGEIDVSRVFADDGDSSVVKKFKKTTRTIRQGKDQPPITETVIEIELHDPLKAAELIGRNERLWIDVIEKPPEIPTAAKASDDVLRAEAARAIEAGEIDPDELAGLTDDDTSANNT